MSMGTKRAKQTDQEIVKLYTQGKTALEIGRIFGCTRQNIHVVLKRYNISAADGGARLRAEEKQLLEFERRMSKRANKVWASSAFYLAAVTNENGQLLHEKETWIRRYATQRASFLKRWANQEPPGDTPQERQEWEAKWWQLSFDEWFTLWHESPHINEYGRGVDKYSLIRRDRKGAFKLGNVMIAKVKPQKYMSFYVF